MSEIADFTGNIIRADGFDGPVTNSDVEALTALGGTLTGTVDGDLADVAALSTSDTYTDAAVNVAITSINLQLKELQTKINAIIAAIQA